MLMLVACGKEEVDDSKTEPDIFVPEVVEDIVMEQLEQNGYTCTTTQLAFDIPGYPQVIYQDDSFVRAEVPGEA